MPLSKVLVDSSFLIALFNVDDYQHDNVNEIAESYRGRFVVPQVVMTEATYMIGRENSIWGAIAFLREFTHWKPELIEVTMNDLERAASIMEQYLDAELDFVDCCIMALAERLDITEICTLDVRDFGIFRPTHCDYFELLP
jgi:predicted nucleic acid-binding protein